MGEGYVDHGSAQSWRSSQSLDKRRGQLSHAKARSTIRRLGSTRNRCCSLRLTISRLYPNIALAHSIKAPV